MSYSEYLDRFPPPSYELSQVEFDTKTSHAVEASLQAPIREAEEGLWEVWDDDLFEANSSGAGVSSSSISPIQRQTLQEKSMFNDDTPLVRPLRIVKKGTNSPPHRPPSTMNGHSIRRHAPLPSPILSRSSSIRCLSPPPTFESIGPSLDGPPYEEVTRRYPASRPASPLSIDTSPNYQRYHSVNASTTSAPAVVHPRPMRSSRSSYQLRRNLDASSAYPRPPNRTRAEVTSVMQCDFNPADLYAAPVAQLVKPMLPKSNPMPARGQRHQQGSLSYGQPQSTTYYPDDYSGSRSPTSSESNYSQQSRFSANHRDIQWPSNQPLQPNR